MVGMEGMDGSEDNKPVRAADSGASAVEQATQEIAAVSTARKCIRMEYPPRIDRHCRASGPPSTKLKHLVNNSQSRGQFNAMPLPGEIAAADSGRLNRF